jgi:hypothetical protein
VANVTIPDEDDISGGLVRLLGVDSARSKRIIEAFREHFAKPFAGRLAEITLAEMMKTKNPYLYRSVGISTCQALIERAFNDYASSSAETYYGQFFEAVARIMSGGIKPVGGGEIDLDIRYNGVVELYVIKSGPKGFNKSSRSKAVQELESAEGKLRQDKLRVEKYIVYAYGRKRTTVQRGIVHLASKEFWSRITRDDGYYLKLLDACHILAPLYAADVAEPLKRLLIEAAELFCDGDAIDWARVLKLISG